MMSAASDRLNFASSLGTQPLGRILVVEDEAEIRDLIVLHLLREGLKADATGSAEEAARMLKQNSYSLVVLDWMLPGMSGVQMAKNLRSEKLDNVSILMVTARAEAADIVEGLDAGADDYLSKPFEPTVLIARVKALLRRASRAGAAETVPGSPHLIQLGELTLNTETYEVKCQDTPISLTPSEFKLMVALAHNRGRVLTRESLIDQIQGEGVSVVGRTVDTHVFGLRKKLGICADVIETVRGIGYRVKPSELG
jgi:two-component system phosphate regulon response regulator PhoB